MLSSSWSQLLQRIHCYNHNNIYMLLNNQCNGSISYCNVFVVLNKVWNCSDPKKVIFDPLRWHQTTVFEIARRMAAVVQERAPASKEKIRQNRENLHHLLYQSTIFELTFKRIYSFPWHQNRKTYRQVVWLCHLMTDYFFYGQGWSAIFTVTD